MGESILDLRIEIRSRLTEDVAHPLFLLQGKCVDLTGDLTELLLLHAPVCRNGQSFVDHRGAEIEYAVVCSMKSGGRK
jgi:hypothetical protein